MKIEQIEMTKEEAKKEYDVYKDAVKTNKEHYIEIMKKAFYHLKNGRKIIDIYKAMKKAGIDKDGRPRLALSRADFVNCEFKKEDTGRGVFFSGSTWRNKNVSLSLPTDTFPAWEREEVIRNNQKWMRIMESELITKVPLVPPLLKPKGSLENLYILWEPKTWELAPPARDPFLLRRLSENIFVVLAMWDVTPLEQSVIRGLRWK